MRYEDGLLEVCHHILSLNKPFFRSKRIGGRKISVYLSFLEKQGIIVKWSRKKWRVNIDKLREFVRRTS